MRVIAGRLRGRTIRVPEGKATRPTSDRVRESLFARLGDLSGCRVLDLFAGSGALGIEALSRGAASLVSVESAHRAAVTIRRNFADLGLVEKTQLMRMKCSVALARLGEQGARFDLVFLDPPYAEGVLEQTLVALAHEGLMASGGVVVAEGAKRHSFQPVGGFRLEHERRHGDTIVRVLIRADDERPAQDRFENVGRTGEGASERRNAGSARARSTEDTR